MDKADKTKVKRYKFRCWKCPRVYFQSLEITDQEKIIVTCPYCRADAVVNLQPYYRDLTTVLKHKEDNDTQTEREEGFQAPEIFPTRKLE